MDRFRDNHQQSVNKNGHRRKGCEILPIVMSHHQHFISGYEDRDNGNGNNNIPLGSRVIAVASAFDAMTTDRPYRKGMPPWKH